MSECKVYRREIDEAADGGVMSNGARAHAVHCHACGDALRERESLRALVGGLGRVEAPADFEFRLRARMAAAKSDGGRGRFSGARWFYSLAPVAVAACFVVVSATLYLRQASRATKTDTPVVAAQAHSAEPVRVSSNSNEQSGSAKTEDAGGSNVQSGQTDVASSVTQKPVHRVGARVTRAREVASKGERRTGSAQNTTDFTVTGAQVLHPISVKASGEPLRVILRDERGAERVVPMRSVSFGSQDFLARGTATRPATNVEVGGVW